jgi:hypothetical protein
MLIPLIAIASGVATVLTVALTGERTVPVHEPDTQAGPMPAPAPAPGVAPVTGPFISSGYKLVNAILGELQKAAQSSGIPLGLLVGWIARESGGRIGEVTLKYDERGYFQLMPSESKALGIDHQRLSTDSNYSINAGLLLIGKYMKQADALGVAPHGSSYYWKLVKLLHTMGTGAVQKIVPMAQAAGRASSWAALEDFALTHNDEIYATVKHSPSKWFPLVDKVYAVGRPFGFGTDFGQPTAVVGGAGGGLKYNDIPDPLTLLPKYKRRG